jgi:hypothetical protein
LQGLDRENSLSHSPGSRLGLWSDARFAGLCLVRQYGNGPPK